MLTTLSNDGEYGAHFVGRCAASLLAMSMVIPVDAHCRRRMANLLQDARICFINRVTITAYQSICHCFCCAAEPAIHACTNDVLHCWHIVFTKFLNKFCRVGTLWRIKLAKAILVT